ncbi:MAG: ribokinase [Leptolyngbya foveolarum]|uniref:Ribokinase n=1 Tax=Leptolyngbya foveolarum TaxID=47253 RepID=A0A2W4WG32_9CYAN|nr:MAG: ribokinase [Leptolyngbya foveolarum]
MAKKHGLFVGLTTLDCFYQADHPPAANEKVVADQSLLVAGGPATNAAVAFAQLGGSTRNKASLLSVIGGHPLTTLLRKDLRGQGVTLCELDENWMEPPPVSSIVVSKETGDRAVIARDVKDLQVQATQSPDVLAGVSVVLIDGHQMAASAQIAQWAKARQIPVVVDAGSWKPQFETVLAIADVVVASANFWPPDCQTLDSVFAYLSHLDVPQIAITRGHQPIEYLDEAERKTLEVPQIKAVDTLGAGDIFHGAFCHFYLTHTFEEALLKASRVASFACQHWGTRDWTQVYRMTDDEAAASDL